MTFSPDTFCAYLLADAVSLYQWSSAFRTAARRRMSYAFIFQFLTVQFLESITIRFTSDRDRFNLAYFCG
jgi:hypothetical protein